MNTNKCMLAKILALTVFCAPMSIYAAPAFAASPKESKVIVADFRGVAKKALPAVVSIQVKSLRSNGSGDDADLLNDALFKRFFGRIPRSQQSEQVPQESQGSGFIVSADGSILTNQHLVREAKEIVVILNDGREFPAKVIGQDPNTDIAVIKIDAKDLPYLTIGNSDDLEVGQWVVAIGTPLGLQASLTVGVVSAKGRNNLDIENVEDFIQTDVPVNQGNSGGPLLDLDGSVVGMNTAIVTQNGSGGYMGISFSIPSNMIRHVYDEIIATGKVSRGYIGIYMQQMDRDLAQAFGLKSNDGALVAEVKPDSPAAKAGLKQGDVILKVNDQKVVNVAILRNLVALTKPNSTINLEVLRDKKSIPIIVKVDNFPVETPEAEQVAGKYGFAVGALTVELAEKFGYKDDKGVVITKVESTSPIALAGVRAGALILAINRQQVNTLDDYHRLLASADKDAPVLLLIKQGKAVRYFSIRID